MRDDLSGNWASQNQIWRNLRPKWGHKPGGTPIGQIPFEITEVLTGADLTCPSTRLRLCIYETFDCFYYELVLQQKHPEGSRGSRLSVTR